MLVDNGGITALGTTLLGDLGPDTTEYHNVQVSTNTYAGIRLHSNGSQYYADQDGVFTITSHGLWLIQGANSNFWVRCTVDTGSLDWTNSGAGSWLALTSTLSWGIIDDSAGASPETCDITLELATDSGGSNIVDTVQYTLSAWNST